MNILFVCTSGKDRSPALVEHYSKLYPKHEFKSAGINNYFTGMYNKHHINQDDIDWANLLVCCETVHKDYIIGRFSNIPCIKTLNCGHFSLEREQYYFENSDKIVPELINSLSPVQQ